MSDSTPPTPTQASFSSQPYSQSNPIDLTGDDDDSDYSAGTDRKCKRTCSSNRIFNAAKDGPPTFAADTRFQQYHSGLSPAMSQSTLHPDNRLPPSAQSPYPSSSSQMHRPQEAALMPPPTPPIFVGPSNSSAFFPSPHMPHQLGPSSHALSTSSMTLPHPQMSPFRPPSYPIPLAPAPSQQDRSSQVIDLTRTPSPPPPRPQQPQQLQPPLPADLPPKTPVCIGQLTVTALVLYPIAYLQPQRSHNSPDGDWAPVRMSYEHNAARPGNTETIHIRTPNLAGAPGEVIPGENFGVVEQKVATLLGPMLGKGLIRLDGKVRRGQPNLPILPLTLLVYTPKGNIAVVASYLHQHALFLDHPTVPSDMERLKSQHYWNPHNPPPGGHNRGLFGPNHGTTVGRWNTVSGKSVEVQRSQIDELFKSLKDGDELPETDPPPELGTSLYPHQKKALTFMLEREGERPISGGSALWQERFNPISNERSWFHVVTQREVFEEPRSARGAILADDMGLGKTISCVALLGCTLQSAREFAVTPLETPIPPPPAPNDLTLSAAHFAGSVWGIPNGGEPSAKGKAKATREHDKLEAEYIRSCRIKTKSRATLIVCPLSTVVNWEEQFREHWRGEVEVVGGAGTVCTPQTQPVASSSSTPSEDSKGDMKSTVTRRVRAGAPLRVYVYHGNSRKPDPTFLADFDAVITTYSTLAVEYSKQSKSLEGGDDEEEDGTSSDGFIETDDRGNQIIRLPKSKKAAVKKRKKPCGGTGTEITSPLQSVHWFRVVLDEAHSIKEVSTVACRACCDLVADRRLCLTGTPVQNKLDDVYALLKFIKLEPFDEKAVWTEFIGTPVKYGQTVGVARLQSIMKFITLRRTKESKAENGQKILTLPPRRDELRYLKFDEHEKAIYDQFFTESKAEFNELSKQNEVMKNYVGILQKILRLRQICDHFELVMNKGLGLIGDLQSPETPSYEELTATIAKDGINTSRAISIFALLREAGTAQCVDCGYDLGVPLENAEGDACGPCETDVTTVKRGRKPKAAASRAPTRQNSPSGPVHAILTRCQHLFCIACFRNSNGPGWPTLAPDTKLCCGVCRTTLTSMDAVEFVPDALNAADIGSKKKSGKREKRQKGMIDVENYHASTKIKVLLNDLIHFSRGNPHSANYDPNSIEIQMVDDKGNNVDDGIVKTVVFSQWTSMLDKIEDALELSRIRYDRLDGTMKRDERTRAMEALKHDPGCEVLLVSLKAGGVGLNLTAAQRVYLMDPYWNPAVENQAVDRIHRLGQTRPVTTVKLIIENSIEARLLEVQRKKTELANMTLGQNFSKTELLQRRIEELNQLFG